VPTYDYKCPTCNHQFDVVKRIANIDDLESCPACLNSCDKKSRIITKGKEFFGEKPDEAFYSVSLGKMVKSKKDQARQAKQRGWIEVGNEDVNKINQRADQERERRSSERWQEYLNPKYNVRA
jgi:putative FmdB family regulatory protein